MKSPLRRLRNFTFSKHENKEKTHQKAAKLDELVEAAKDLQDLRNSYESIVAAASNTANNAYESSEALEELGTCFLEKNALSDEEYGGRALMMLGKVQFELRKLFNGYRAHVFHTMVTPSKSLLKELEILEEMKIQCDTKRELYESMLLAHKERRKSRNAKGDTVILKELQEAQADYEEEATLFVFRLKSLKQGQFRSLLTQATRHHAAQLSFFRKGLKALEAVEPHVKAVADQQHIIYNFSELEDDDSDYDGNDYDDNYDGELSFDYKLNRQDQDVINLSRSFEEETTDRSQSLYNFSLRAMPSSQSAPISTDGKSYASDKIKQLQPSSRKFHTYALPTPTIDIKSNSNNTIDLETKARWWHSSPLDAKTPTKDLKESLQSNSTKSPSTSSYKGGNIHSGPIPTNAYFGPSEGMALPKLNPLATSVSINRQAFSGPIRSAHDSSKPRYSTSDSETLLKVHPVVSVAAPSVSKNRPSVSPPNHRSPSLVSRPKISELHELPRPPVSPDKRVSSSSLVGYSGPLVSRVQVPAVRNKTPLDVFSKMSPLPTPPSPMTRSFSIPTRGNKETVLSVGKVVEPHGDSDSTKEVTSPALIPSSLATAGMVSPMDRSK